MVTPRRRIVALILLLALAVSALPASAQEAGRTISISEEWINETYRVTNPARRSVTNVHVDLQTGEAAISATVTLPRQAPVGVIATFVPYIENGRIYWTATAVTKDGEPVSDELLRQINNTISYSWRSYIRRQHEPGRVTAIDISDTEITITLAAPARPSNANSAGS